MLRKEYRDGKEYLVEENITSEISPVKLPAGARIKSTVSIARFEICKICDQARENGFKCVLHKGCCFGSWRANPANQCPLGKWFTLSQTEGPTVEIPANDKE